MKRVLAILALAAGPLVFAAAATAQVVPGHRLPEGPERPVRDRSYDIESYKAELAFDMAKESIAGVATITFQALRAPLATLSLDAADIVVTKVERDGKAQTFASDPAAFKLDVTLDPPVPIGQAATVAISYTVKPRAGMYFYPGSGKLLPQAWNYGEGGLHRGWLPIYNDTNERFAIEFIVTVPKGLTVVANGRLAETRDNANGTRTFHWIQKGPIPNYLVTVDVAELSKVPLRDAKVGDKTIPLAAWTPPGTEEAARFVFGNTPDMVEYFSTKMGYPYPWDKYDQVVLREFAGAMETTTATGFSESELRRAGDPPDLAPEYEIRLARLHLRGRRRARARPPLVRGPRDVPLARLALAERVLRHLLAHDVEREGARRGRHDVPALGVPQRVRRLRARDGQRPADGVPALQGTGRDVPAGDDVREGRARSPHDPPLPRRGGLRPHDRGVPREARVLERRLGGFEGGDRARSGPQPQRVLRGLGRGRRRSPALRGVVSVGARAEGSRSDGPPDSGRSPFENDFRLPVEVEIADAAGAKTHRVELSGWSTTVALPAASRPTRVTFDKGGWLVCEVQYVRPISEVLAELSGADLAGKLRAARQLANDFPTDPRSLDALSRVLADPSTHWGLKQEAALDLGRIGGSSVQAALTKALASPDQRVRRAAALALGHAGEASAADALRRTVETDKAEDVVAVAEVSLGRLRAPGAKDFLLKQLGRDSRYWDSVRLGALIGLGKLGDPSLASTFAKYTAPGYVQDVRIAALGAWEFAAPEDPNFAASLRKLTSDRNRTVRLAAIQKLGKLHRAEDLALLEALQKDPDPNVVVYATDGIDELGASRRRPTTGRVNRHPDSWKVLATRSGAASERLGC